MVFALAGALLMAFASIWLVFGILIELLLGLVAVVIRGNGLVGVGKKLQDFIIGLTELHKELLDAWNASLNWDLEASFSTTDQACTVTALTPASATEPGFTTAYSFCAQTRAYKDGGVRLDYRLTAGRIELRAWSSTDGPTSTAPAWRQFADGGGISYHLTRSGQRLGANQLPRFDMIVASNDRVFAKVHGKADFWFGTPAEMFAGTEIDAGPPVPSLYFKIDPTPLVPPVRRVLDISNVTDTDELKLKDYSGTHPQAARLPLLHALVGGGALPAMVVSVKPRTMYQLDTRPPRVGVSMNQVLTDSPTGLKTRPASKHKSSAGPEEVQDEFEFDRVQGMGVGNYHFYENWTADHGGEIQFLLMNSAFGLRLSTALYGLFNGPIQDADGACDGTCNFYVLARLKRNDGSHRWGILWCDEQTFFTKRWRLVDPRDNLPAKLNLPDDVNLSVHALVENDRSKGILNGMIDFDIQRFIASDPFEQGNIDERSRLAVARQVLVVNGTRKVLVPNGSRRIEKQDCLYSINFSYGSIDRQWRVRPLPGPRKFSRLVPPTLPTNPPSPPTPPSPPDLDLDFDLLTVHTAPTGGGLFSLKPEFDFDSLHLREDLTISLRGSLQGPHIDGRWVQRYLPCDRRHPVKTFTHPWRYLPEASYQRLLRYPMFGVLDPQADGRNQYYEIEVLTVDDVPVQHAGTDATLRGKLAALDGLAMADLSDALYIRARVFKWGAMKKPVKVEEWLTTTLPESIEAGEEIGETSDRFFFSWHETPDPETEYRQSRTSMYNPRSKFRFLQRGQLGWLLVWEDKRDDDLIALSDLPMEVTLEIEAASVSTATPNDGGTTQPQRVKVRINRHQRIDLPPCASRVDFVPDPAGVSGSLIVRIHSPLPPVQFLRNVWKLHLASLPQGANAPRHMGRATGGSAAVTAGSLQGLHIQSGTVASTPSGGSMWSMTVIMSPQDIDALKDDNEGEMATCVWLEGPSGMMSTPDLIKFMA